VTAENHGGGVKYVTFTVEPPFPVEVELCPLSGDIRIGKTPGISAVFEYTVTAANKHSAACTKLRFAVIADTTTAPPGRWTSDQVRHRLLALAVRLETLSFFQHSVGYTGGGHRAHPVVALTASMIP